MEQKIDKEVFDTFFRENYVPVDYATVREEFYEITADKEEVFSEELEDKPLTEKNFILYMRSDIYCQLEGCVEDAFEMLNPEITDAVMDISMSISTFFIIIIMKRKAVIRISIFCTACAAMEETAKQVVKHIIICIEITQSSKFT